MMSAMRENMPLIMWILVGAFLATIVFSWGMGGFKSSGSLTGVVGKVGTHEILYDQYNKRVQDRVTRQRQQDTTAVQLTEAQIRQFKKEIWDEIVRQELMGAYQERLGVVMSDKEVAYAVRNSPPSWIRENENFLRDGQFDPQKYEEFLRSPSSADVLIAIEKDYRTSMGNQKVIDRLIAPIYVTDTEAWDEYVATTQKFKAAAISFPLRSFLVDSTSITSSEIQEYYTQYPADYQRPERRKLSYVAFPVQPTREDTGRVIEQALEALKRALDGEDFAALAEEYSEDEGSAVKGGDLGYFTKGRMVKEFDSTAFATEPGKVVGPVTTRFGAHVIKVVDRQKGAEADSVRASHILIKWKYSSDTEERISQKAKDFTDAAKAEGFDKAASRFGAEVKETDWFPKSASGSIPGLGTLTPAMDFTFAAKRGAISYLYKTKVRADDNYVVLSLKDISPAGLIPLPEVENAIRGNLVKKKQEQLALQRAEQFRQRVKMPEQFLAEAARESLKVDTTGEHTRRDFLRVFGTDESIARVMFGLEPGRLAPALSNARGAYVAVLISKSTVDSAEFQTKKMEIADRLRRTKQNNVYSDWLATAQKEIGVEDDRHLYYTDY